MVRKTATKKHLVPDQCVIDAQFEPTPEEIERASFPTRETDIAALEVNSLMRMVDIAEGTSAKFAAIILATRKISEKADKNDIESLYNCLFEYIKFCIDHDVRITNTGAYSACGLSKQIIDYWASGKERSSNPEYKQFALYIRNICAEYREMLMSESKIHPAVGIWWQKNYDHFTDEPTRDVDARDVDSNLTATEIARKYQLIGDD